MKDNKPYRQNKVFDNISETEEFNVYTKIDDLPLNETPAYLAEIPVETALPMETLFKDVAGRDFTITDKNSEVYTNGIGDPHWIK